MTTKQSLNINFAQGLDTKTDPFQVSAGKFLTLQNSVFNKGGMLQKRNGYSLTSTLPTTSSTFLTTFNSDLAAIGDNLYSYIPGTGNWVNKGKFYPIDLSVTPIVRSSTNQSYADSAISLNGLVCTVFTDQVPVSGTVTPEYKYTITDLSTGQNIVNPTALVPPVGVVEGSMRIFALGKYFIIIYTSNNLGTYSLRYAAINSTVPTTIYADNVISSSYVPATTTAFDAVLANNILYITWNSGDIGGGIRIAYLTQQLQLSSSVAETGHAGSIISIAADSSGSTPVLYVTYYDSSTHNGYTTSFTSQLVPVLAPTLVISGIIVENIVTSADAGLLTVLYEVYNQYSYGSTFQTDYISKVTCTASGTVGSPSVVKRSVGLASKAVLVNSVIYYLAIYVSDYQPTYFLLDSNGDIVSKLAYSNGGTWYTTGLPNLVNSSNILYSAYLIRDLIAATNKSQTAASTFPVYAQTGINLAQFTLGISTIVTSNIAGNLHLTGGYLWNYDGQYLGEQGFHLWPDNVYTTSSATMGSMTAQQYFYQVTYEWTDAQGNLYRSAPSIPSSVTLTSDTSVELDIPTLRLTNKTNAVIVIYRWSVAQQIFYQVTSLENPTLNDPTVDSIQYIDKQADSSIVGNNILYTTGGVVEDIAPPALSSLTLFKSRLVGLDSEDRNLLWYSKQVIENVPVEMSDLFTIYVAPTISAQGSTGPITALSVLDDKLIIFKRDAIYYITGNGPDNTGANNDFSDPVFITATVGCANQESIVFMPQGLMFQSDKGIWLLGRDLSTSYIGAPVEGFNTQTITSAVSIPGTNQVRFTAENITLVYDYYYGQWSTFTNVEAISSTLFQDMHTYLSESGQIYQETPGMYLDGARPVLMSFTTNWYALAGIQGLSRFFYMLLLGQYYTPFKLQVQMAYDFNSNPQYSTIVTQDNASPTYGQAPIYGDGSPYGGNGNVFEARVFTNKQKVQSFQLIVNEMYDPSYGIAAGAGLTLSGMNLIVGMEKGYRLSPASRNFT